MAKASKFGLSAGFAQSLRVRSSALENAAIEGMEKAMQQAEQDAQNLYRWHQPGEYSQVGSNGDLWTWQVTGTTAATITAYVVPNKQLKAANPGKLTHVEREIDRTDGSTFTKTYPHEHNIDPALTWDYPERPGKVLGVVTMYTAYAPYLQVKEIAGGKWGSPSAGQPVTIEVLDVYWETVYVPLIERVITRRMDRYGR